MAWFHQDPTVAHMLIVDWRSVIKINPLKTSLPKMLDIFRTFFFSPPHITLFCIHLNKQWQAIEG
jgi:hypothetical protein